MKRNKIGTSSRAMRGAGSKKPDGDSKYARKYKSGNSMYCKRNQRGNNDGIETTEQS